MSRTMSTSALHLASLVLSLAAAAAAATDEAHLAPASSVERPLAPATRTRALQSAQDDLDSARSLFDSKETDGSYAYTYRNSCFCVPVSVQPMDVTVLSGSVVDVTFDEGASDEFVGTEVPKGIKEGVPTIATLFDRIQSAIDDGAPSIMVTYDKTYGYPTRIQIDWDLMVADEETNISASDYVPDVPSATMTTSTPIAKTSSMPMTTTTDDVRGDPLSLALTAVNDAQNLWDSFNLSDYDYRYIRICFCPPEWVQPLLVSVRSRSVASVVFAEDASKDVVGNNTDVPDQVKSNVKTVDDLFGMIRKAIDDGADRVTVTYDKALGYPRNTFIDRSEMIADEETTVIVEDLVPFVVTETNVTAPSAGATTGTAGTTTGTPGVTTGTTAGETTATAGAGGPTETTTTTMEETTPTTPAASTASAPTAAPVGDDGTRSVNGAAAATAAPTSAAGGVSLAGAVVAALSLGGVSSFLSL